MAAVETTHAAVLTSQYEFVHSRLRRLWTLAGSSEDRRLPMVEKSTRPETGGRRRAAGDGGRRRRKETGERAGAVGAGAKGPGREKNGKADLGREGDE